MESGRSGRKYLFLYSVSGMITECSEPKIKMTLEGEKSGGVYRGDVTVKIEVEDLQAGDTYSGIQQVFYHVAAEEMYRQIRRKFYFKRRSSDTRKGKMEGAVVIPAEVFNSNDVRVQVTVKDSAGNEKTENKEKIAIDITPPILHVQYDDQMPVNGNYTGRHGKRPSLFTREILMKRLSKFRQAVRKEGNRSVGNGPGRKDGKIRIRIHM